MNEKKKNLLKNAVAEYVCAGLDILQGATELSDGILNPALTPSLLAYRDYRWMLEAKCGEVPGIKTPFEMEGIRYEDGRLYGEPERIRVVTRDRRIKPKTFQDLVRAEIMYQVFLRGEAKELSSEECTEDSLAALIG